MKLSQRISSFDIEHHKALIEEFKAHPGSCNDVWLSTLYGYPSVEDHRKTAESLAVIAEMYREAGISVSLQISNTLGHGEYMSTMDCSGLVYEGSPVEKIVGPNGAASDYSFCPRGRFFKKYILDTLAFYIPIKPDCLWVDDDFRLPNHAPVDFGCFCDDCIAEFNRIHGSSFTREELTNEILYGDLKWRERYFIYQRNNMHDLMIEIMELFHKGSPDTVGGLQHAVPGGFIMGDHNFAFGAMLEVTGKPPKSRPGGGAYTDHEPGEVMRKGLQMAMQIAALPEYVTEVYPEIENLPHCVFGKSPAGTAFETTFFFMCGASDMSYSMMQGVESLDWYGTILKLFSAQRDYWEKLSEYNSFTRASGFRHFYSKNNWTRTVKPGGDLRDIHAYKHFGTMELLRDAVPLVYDRRENSILFLHPDEVNGMTKEDVDHLLSCSVITDGEVVEKLLAKGVDLGITVDRISTVDGLAIYEKYTDHPFNGGVPSYKSSFFTKGKTECYRLTVGNADAEVLGYYATYSSLKPYTPGTDYPYGIAELVLTTSKGGKWVIMGYQPWKSNIPMTRRDRLLNIADAIATAPLAARVVSRHQAFLYPRIDNDGNTACVSVANCTVGKMEEGELLIRSPRSTRFVFRSQCTPTIELEGVKTADGYLVKIPTLDAWTAGTVFCE